MLARVFSAAVLGIDAYVVEVEADITPQIPRFNTVGLPDGAVRESKERVQSAIRNSGFIFPCYILQFQFFRLLKTSEDFITDLKGILHATQCPQRHPLIEQSPSYLLPQRRFGGLAKPGDHLIADLD